MILATARDSSEPEMIELILTHFDSVAANGFDKILVLGATLESPGVWAWDGDNCPFYTTADGCLQPGGYFWLPNEPNDLSGTATGLEVAIDSRLQSNENLGWNDFQPQNLRIGLYEKPLSSSCKRQAYYIAPSMAYAGHLAKSAQMGLSLAKVKNQDDHDCIKEIAAVLGDARYWLDWRQ
ncbi:unnamed protein product [Cylindrotheca closterium]|uniref:Uncharacterized protein n=1 Tax=Cylindrotheca closterium TaxID=2856 RepID=A0AAD2G4M6_9STRA|nr:unnamed protein product [Cylindrotheca closterium]